MAICDPGTGVREHRPGAAAGLVPSGAGAPGTGGAQGDLQVQLDVSEGRGRAVPANVPETIPLNTTLRGKAFVVSVIDVHY